MDFQVLILVVALIVAVFVVVPVLGLGRKSSVAINNNLPLDRQMVKSKWSEIEQTYSLGGASHYKTAVMESDKLLDYVLKAKVGGEGTMADRLKRAQRYFHNNSDYNDIWYAHKIRNQVAHEAGFNLSPVEAKKVIKYFEKSFKKLGVI